MSKESKQEVTLEEEVGAIHDWWEEYYPHGLRASDLRFIEKLKQRERELLYKVKSDLEAKHKAELKEAIDITIQAMTLNEAATDRIIPISYIQDELYKKFNLLDEKDE